MLLGKRVLAVVPARGGSKGIPLKNLALVNGRPLISYTLDVALQMDWIDMISVSTDHKKIMDEVDHYPAVHCVERPKDLSGDRIGDMPVLNHALGVCERISQNKFDVVLMLQPTSPIRTIDQIEICTIKLIEGLWESVWTVSETDLKYHPLKQLVINTEDRMNFFVPGGNKVIARQQLEKTYFRNGICYAFTENAIRSSDSVWVKNSTSVVVTNEPFVNIDSYEDLQLADMILFNQSKG
jgi:CMP-N-acetylneuraminic acid synthetase